MDIISIDGRSSVEEKDGAPVTVELPTQDDGMRASTATKRTWLAMLVLAGGLVLVAWTPASAAVLALGVLLAAYTVWAHPTSRAQTIVLTCAAILGVAGIVLVLGLLYPVVAGVSLTR